MDTEDEAVGTEVSDGDGDYNSAESVEYGSDTSEGYSDPDYSDGDEDDDWDDYDSDASYYFKNQMILTPVGGTEGSKVFAMLYLMCFTNSITLNPRNDVKQS